VGQSAGSGVNGEFKLTPPAAATAFPAGSGGLAQWSSNQLYDCFYFAYIFPFQEKSLFSRIPA
jgi:hypothetical protein